MTDFASVVQNLKSVRRKHHGRSPEEGLDCVGLIMWAYSSVGLPIDDLDVPYGVSDAEKSHRAQAIEERLLRRFKVVDSPQCDGDVVVLQMGHQPSHLGILVGDRLFEMRERLRSSRMQRLRPFVAAVYRHEKLIGAV